MAVPSQENGVEDMLAARRQRGLAVRNLIDPDTLPVDRPKAILPSPGSWLRRLVVQFAIVVVVGLAILAVPSLFSCRDLATQSFTNGQFGRCVVQTTFVRLASMEQQIQVLALNFRR